MIRWFAGHPTASNLLLIVLLALGIFSAVAACPLLVGPRQLQSADTAFAEAKRKVKNKVAINSTTAKIPITSTIGSKPSLYNTIKKAKYTSADPVSFCKTIKTAGKKIIIPIFSKFRGSCSLKLYVLIKRAKAAILTASSFGDVTVGVVDEKNA